MKDFNENSPRIYIVISKDVKIELGQPVPILQHTNCAGSMGRVVDIEIQENTYKILCNDCEKSAILDIKTLVGS